MDNAMPRKQRVWVPEDTYSIRSQVINTKISFEMMKIGLSYSLETVRQSVINCSE